MDNAMNDAMDNVIVMPSLQRIDDHVRTLAILLARFMASTAQADPERRTFLEDMVVDVSREVCPIPTSSDADIMRYTFDGLRWSFDLIDQERQKRQGAGSSTGASQG